MKINNKTQYALLAGLGLVGLGLAGSGIKNLVRVPAQQLKTLAGLSQHKATLLQTLGGLSVTTAAGVATGLKVRAGKTPEPAQDKEPNPLPQKDESEDEGNSWLDAMGSLKRDTIGPVLHVQ